MHVLVEVSAFQAKDMVKAFKKGSLYWIIQVNQTAIICVLIEGQGESWHTGSIKAKQMADDDTTG